VKHQIFQGEIMKSISGRRRSIGLAGAALWLIAISFVFITWSLLAIGTPTANLLLIGSFTVVGAFITVSILVLRGALGLPMSTVPRTTEGKKMGRRFALVFGAEIAAFAIINPVMAASGNFELMPSVNLIVVGIHFLPLARIFRVPRYYFTGLLFCGIPIITLIAIPKQFEIGHTLAWYVVPSLGCGLVASLTAAAGLLEAWNYVRDAA
jgi:hypothetical protein